MAKESIGEEAVKEEYPDLGLSDSMRDELLGKAADNLEIDLVEEEVKDEGSDEPEPDKKVSEDEPSEDMIDVGGTKVPKAVVSAIVEAVKADLGAVKPSEDKKPESKETTNLKAERAELLDKARKAAVGDEALLAQIDLMAKIQEDLDNREKREFDQAREAEQIKADQQLILSDMAEVEKEFGVKLPAFGSKEFQMLIDVAKGVKVNRLREAYVKLKGKGDKPKPNLKSIDSNKQERVPEGYDAEAEAEANAWRKKLGLKPKR